MVQEIALEELLERIRSGQHIAVDVRSPKEFEESAIPSSLNIPVFNNEERAEIGTLYKQVSPEAAKERGLELFSRKLPSFINEFKAIERPFTVYCWRGGMRSKTAATVLELMGIETTRLTGGIRSYRQWVVKQLEEQEFGPQFIVLNGYTGSGKTTILRKLKEMGHPVIDLEQLAGHRGSIFGQIGLKPNSQKQFESQLVEEMDKLKNEPFIFIEGESKRIGKVLIPSLLFDKKEAGKQIILHLPIEERVANLVRDYEPHKYPDLFLKAFQLIKKRLTPAMSLAIEEHMEKQEFDAVAELLLLHYYDPRYKHSAFRNPERHIDIHANTTEEAIDKICDVVLPAIAQSKY